MEGVSTLRGRIGPTVGPPTFPASYSLLPGPLLMKPSIRSSFLLSALLPLACGQAGEPSSTRDQTTVETGLVRAVDFEAEDDSYTVQERMAHHGVPGLSFALIEDGKIAWAGYYGVKRQGGGEPVDEETLFQAASVSKPLVVVAALRMRDAGLLDLDADVESYLEEYDLPEGEQSASDRVTLRKLLAHTAGTTPGGFQGYARGTPLPTDLQVVQGASPANSPPVRVETAPGERLAYSGGGYTIVEIALQDITGRSFDSLMGEWVLSEARMTNSTFGQPLPAELEARAAHAHTAGGSVVEGGWRVHPEQAAAGLWSTAPDLARFAVELRRSYLGAGHLLAEASAREMLTELSDGHGLGIELRGENESRAFAHAGGNVGYRAFMILYLDSGNGAVFMTNSDRGMALGVEMLRAASSVYGWPDFHAKRFRRVTVARDSLQKLAGRYDFGEVIVEATLPEDGTPLSATFPNGDVYRLIPTAAGSFVHPETGTTVEFSRVDDRPTMSVFGDTGFRLSG